MGKDKLIGKAHQPSVAAIASKRVEDLPVLFYCTTRNIKREIVVGTLKHIVDR